MMRNSYRPTVFFSSSRPRALAVNRSIFRFSLILSLCAMLACSCNKGGGSGNGGGGGGQPPTDPQLPVASAVSFWMTTQNEVNLFKKQNVTLNWAAQGNGNGTIEVDSSVAFQEIDGFGYTLTGGSADLLMGMSASARAALLKELFATDSNNIGVSYLRLSIGASDLSASVFSYNEMPAGQTDPNLQNFSLGVDEVNLIPVLKEILAINPSIKLMGTPWSAPRWMKDNNNSVGGKLLPQYYGAYAKYFVKYIQAMQSRGITINSITIQNEPLHGGNNPSMLMTAPEQAEFIKNHLGPTFQQAGITTKIIIYDHNCDRPDYPLAILADPAAKQYVDGSAFHLYGGDISALSQVRNAHPDRHVYFTEQYTASNGSFGGDLKWHLKNVIIGSMRNWSRVALEWNLANDPNFGPHTPGGCTTCKGAVTIGTTVSRNVAYYIIAHASKFVRPGSKRVHSNPLNSLENVAFVTPDGKKVLIVENDGGASQTFNIKFKDRFITTTLDAGAVGTYVW
jgi:glucosylceramidase